MDHQPQSPQVDQSLQRLGYNTYHLVGQLNLVARRVQDLDDKVAKLHATMLIKSDSDELISTLVSKVYLKMKFDELKAFMWVHRGSIAKGSARKGKHASRKDRAFKVKQGAWKLKKGASKVRNRASDKKHGGQDRLEGQKYSMA
jgi:hypothetical protein